MENASLERFPFRLTMKLQAPYTESALDSMFVAFPFGKPVSTFPGNALSVALARSLKIVGPDLKNQQGTQWQRVIAIFDLLV